MNLPNKLTISRFVTITLIMIVFLTNFVPEKEIVCAVLFLIGITTDFLDGYLARKYNQVTNLGKLLDPIADKMLVTGSVVLLAVSGIIPNPFGVIVLFILLARDFLVGTIRQMGALSGVAIAADKLGKYKTVVTDIAVLFLFILAYSNANNVWLSATAHNILAFVSYFTLFVGIVLTIVSGANYLIKNKQLFKN